MSREKGSQSIREALKEKDIDRWKRLEEIWRDAEPMFEAIETTVDKPAGKAHSIEVEKDISALIPDDRKEELEPIELFSLSVAACLHDADKALGTPKRKHGDVASANVGIDPDDYDLDLGEADVVRWIIRMHDHGDFRHDLPPDPLPIGGGTDVYIRPLAALFKLADILHADYRRVSSTRPKEAKERARSRILGWKYDDEGKILFRVVPQELDDIEHIHKAIAMMRRAIESIAPILRDAGYAHEIADAEIDDSILTDKVKLKHEAKQKSERSFIGMDSFNEDDEHLFKGREKESNELYELLLLDDPIIALVGDSGTGKTSLIRAGLFPKLRKAGWKYAYTRPLHDPVSDVIREVWLRMMEGKAPDDIDLIETFEHVSEENQGKKLLIVMDQFEDLFRFPDAPEQMAKALYPVQAMRFRNLRIVLSYRADAEGQVGPVLQNVSASPRGMSRKYLQPLDRDGAKEALTAGFEVAQVGFDTDVGEKSFMKLILDDIEAQGSGFYPPYIQMMGETLTDRAENKIVTKSVYDSLGGAGNVIGKYLFNQLESFGDKRGDAERILIELTSVAGSEGKKIQMKSLQDLERELRMTRGDLENLLFLLGRKWMIRHLGGEQYEISHDHLAKLVDENIITVGTEREFRQLREHFSATAAIYQKTSILLDPIAMASLYQNRERVNPSPLEDTILLHSWLAGRGSAWYWFRESASDEYIRLLCSALSLPECCTSAACVLGYAKDRTEMPKLMEMLKSADWAEQQAAAYAIVELVNEADVPELMKMLRDKDWFVQESAARALARLDVPEAIPELMKALKEGRFLGFTILEAILELMTRSGDLESVQKLVCILKHKEPPTMWFLVNLRLAWLSVRDDVPELMKMLKHRDWDAREMSADALLQLIAVEGISELMKFDIKTPRHLWLSAPEELARLGIREAIPELTAMLDDEDWDVWTAAVKALGQLGVQTGLDVQAGVTKLIDILKDEEAFGRKAAAKTLAQLHVQEAIPELMEILVALTDDVEPDTRIELAKTIAQLATRENIPQLIEMFKYREEYLQEEYVQDFAAKAMGSLGSEEDIPLLLDMVIQDGEGASAARTALTLIDRKLYCPFDWPLEINNW